ncbi:MAG: anti-sigma factor [Chroococcidiopsidaceae cyanobacterium CP_BM_ER_R8_30]|nr:anti-sigma factor [Chroococcidiopsidaceae cyanobacterium CP_BM_ER_R8_30]
MTESLFSERLEELMAGYVLGNLSPEEAEELRQLLTAHPELNTEVYRLQEVLELMPYALPEVELPSHLRSAILEVVHGPIPQAIPKRFALPWSKIAVSFATLLVLILGLDNYRLRQQMSFIQAQAAKQKDVIAMLENPTTHLVSLKGMDSAAAASGSVVMTPGEPKAILILQNLPVLPKGQFYQLWSVVDGKKLPSGQFNASARNTVLVKLSIPDSSKLKALVVTVEESPEPKSPSGPMVMTSTL